MAIPFISVGFWKFLDERGACAITAYIGRDVVQSRPGKRYDFRRFRGDLVHEKMLMPRGVTGRPPTPAQFARMIDIAEITRTKTPNPSRVRQLLLTMVVALPPDTECTLDEAIELCHAVVERVIVDQSLMAYVAIHDPAVKFKNSRSRNRHAHIHIALRALTTEGTLSLKKERDLVARVRLNRGAKGNFNAVAEGISWPDVSRELQTRLFTDCGRNVLVDPIALIPQKHFGKLTWYHEEDAVKRHLADIYQSNRQALAAPPKDLISAMLRGRSSITRAELGLLVDRYIDSEQERRDLREWIAADQMIVNLSPAQGQVSRITTRNVYDIFERVRGLIENFVDAPEGVAGAFQTAIGSHATVIISQISDICKDVALRRGARVKSEITIVGHVLSHCDPIYQRLGGEYKGVQAILANDAIAASAKWDDATIVILPRGESLTDLELAQVIVSAVAANARLVLGYDLSKGDGIVERRLATWTTERLAPGAVFAQIADVSETDQIGRNLLQGGYIKSALSHIASHQASDRRLQLAFAGHSRSVTPPGVVRGQSPHFIVVDDERTIPAITETERETATRVIDLVALKTPHGNAAFAVGEWVAFERTDYTSQPARLREGRTARISSISASNNTMTVEHDHGATDTIDLARFPFIRPAYALTIAEARQLSSRFSIEFRITQRDRVYASLLAAARHKGTATIVVAPNVAKNLAELILAAEGHLPAVLPWQLQPLHDIVAEQNVEVVKVFSDGEINSFAQQLLAMPVETSPQVSPAVKAMLRSPAIRGLTLLTPVHKQGFENLIRALRYDAPDRADTVAHLLNPTGGWGSLLGRIVVAMTKGESLKPGPKPHFATIDSPTALDELVAELEPSPMDLNRFRTDLVALTSQTAFPASKSFSKSAGQKGITPPKRIDPTASEFKKK
jgi:hypothetical protein